ncbi:HlyD family type I secretion periplasmic adaptor subunit [Bosea sp. (in: a-proteobacteria)]|uniref:HlyD family type I secretion periplasmic adaptor subunit n=1 Tax=Bosea sp. (in: a-proteobacteria) TaxID=1871050 RepID=UPI00261EC0C3|nr:HlyD family type I secretion periplasmic adaptor subunit [Bosea sp. (in: a-proteobacteria)]MCO5090965.1 HlyD family type I secretion periplasmic adaptor subunit [Bosea sp. (in: a-proteobacteria)]
MKPLPAVAAWRPRFEQARTVAQRWLRLARMPAEGGGDWRGPVRKGYIVIALALGAGGAWATTARLDSAIVAHGSIVVESDRKAVQHLEGGIVEAIAVRDGSEVGAGQVLLRLDTTHAAAQRGVARLGVLQALGEEARFMAQLDRLDRPAFPGELTEAGESAQASRIVLDQERLFRERASAQKLEISILGGRLAQSQKQYESTEAQRNSAAAQAASISDELAKLRPLSDQGYIAATRINPLRRSLTDLQGRIGSLEADLARLSVANDEIRLQINQVGFKAAEEASTRLAECRVRLADAREKLRVAEDVLARSEIRAPRAGRIVGSKVHTVGAVVKPGETMMEIVPQDDDLVVTAKIAPMDVNSLRPGMAAEVRLPSFKGRATPFTVGEVKSVAADALRDEVSQQMVYELRVSVPAAGFPPKIRSKLKPGMPAEVFVPTGERTVIAYLIQPLMDSMRAGFREE